MTKTVKMSVWRNQNAVVWKVSESRTSRSGGAGAPIKEGPFSWHDFLADFTANHSVLLLNAPDASGVAPDGPGQSKPGPRLIKPQRGLERGEELDSSAARKGFLAGARKKAAAMAGGGRPSFNEAKREEPPTAFSFSVHVLKQENGNDHICRRQGGVFLNANAKLGQTD